MKTLGKLKINSEKILNNHDLIQLHGGQATTCCCWTGWGIPLGYILWDNDCCHCACDYVFEEIYGVNNVGGYPC